MALCPFKISENLQKSHIRLIVSRRNKFTKFNPSGNPQVLVHRTYFPL